MYPGRVSGSVEQIHVAAVESEPAEPFDAVEVTADGLFGDRYAEARDLTLIEAEALEGLRGHGIQPSPAEVRRQGLMRGIRSTTWSRALHGRRGGARRAGAVRAQ